jgi:leucyl/phenylalanyl-tRNA--protein transferase
LRLLAAYERGIFPWYSHGQPILWWAPDPRMVLFPQQFRVSRSLRKTLRQGHLVTRVDCDFGATLRACAAPRRSGPETWLNPQMISAYETLFDMAIGHSVCTYQAGQLVGGLYGVQLGQVFFGESMFSGVPDASKVALARLVDECRLRDIRLIDCQVASTHLASLGAHEISREEFVRLLKAYARSEPRSRWTDKAP